MKIINVAGARPNFMKIAPIMEAFHQSNTIEPYLVHTGQHYDERMSDLFFRQLGIPEPDINLGVGSGSHAHQTAEIMKAFEKVVLSEKPDAVLVVGDVNSTIACGMVAVKLGVKLIHVEAGLRSFDRTMPEEINRILTDSISDFLFCSEPSGIENLRNEGIAANKMFLVGNVMIDTLIKNREKAQDSTILEQLDLVPGEYAVMTMHRPANVDDPEALRGLLDAFNEIQKDVPIIFPIHPRTRKNLAKMELVDRIEAMPNFQLLDPVGYLDFMKLMSSAKAILTDSGGIQEESTILKIPCVTMRSNTERPITTDIGTSRIVGNDPEKIVAAWQDINAGNWKEPRIPELWDGKAAQRIAEVLSE